ncbi:claudin-7-like [Scleropages formosus]|uniref:Claudin n=1 Tax=Scleropages formosus TaxID=113540 RepID=A0A8C9RXB0_SCLFO|nr:claudin-1 [Scleropages formosus]
MAVLVLQVVGILMCLVGWVLEISSTSSNVWKVRSHADTVTTNSWQFQGLWMDCAASALGAVQCNRYKTVLGLPVYVQASRALMIISLILGMFGVIVSLLGMKCVKVGNTSDQVKAKIAIIGGILFLLSGISSLTAVSWYAARVVREFYDPFNGHLKFEFGPGLYIGWAGACLAILGGAFLCCSCRGNLEEPPKGYPYNYSMTSQNIYRSPDISEQQSSKAYV